MQVRTVQIVFDGAPGPEAGRFVEVENEAGSSIKLGTWVKRPDGYWALRFQTFDEPPYGEMCRYPNLCEGKGYCPRDPTCGD